MGAVCMYVLVLCISILIQTNMQICVFVYTFSHEHSKKGYVKYLKSLSDIFKSCFIPKLSFIYINL